MSEPQPMDSERTLRDELRILRTLCDETAPHEQRAQLLNSCLADSFVVPEHQIVFESIRMLFPLGPITAAQLLVHLTRRGFPDTDVERYFTHQPESEI